MICDSFKNIFADMEIFISKEDNDEHITFINDEYALVITGNTSKIKVFVPYEDDEYQIMEFDLCDKKIKRFCFVPSDIQNRIIADIQILYEFICKIS